MMETAMVFDKFGSVIRWHEPADRSSGALPDSRSLWDFLWENRNNLGGVAHTHPWNGEVWPSATDLTTFRAVERGLGVKLIWPVVTFTAIKYYVWDEEDESYATTQPDFAEGSHWIQNLEELRRKSHNGG